MSVTGVTVQKRLKDIDGKIANIRKAIENGMPDEDWGYSRMRELLAEKERLSEQAVVIGEAPQIDSKTALAYRTQVDKIMNVGTCEEKKRLIRSCVDKTKIAPDTLEVEISYKIPEAICALCGSGGALHGYLQHVFGVAREMLSALKEWETYQVGREYCAAVFRLCVYCHSGCYTPCHNASENYGDNRPLEAINADFYLDTGRNGTNSAWDRRPILARIQVRV